MILHRGKAGTRSGMTSLLVPQGLDWIEMGGFARGIIPEEHADRGGKQEAAGDCR